ncbi:unnamed protein product [Prorocentrum cordatum]|uniref:Uncharacterized protein n=1 Tax=Prorocentrum cordatum TaxID=2364126 RepID=A0ABN9TI90_9DINO|nr:unnamed protein product [Polarella glacialis]
MAGANVPRSPSCARSYRGRQAPLALLGEQGGGGGGIVGEKTRMQMSRTFSRGPCYGGQLQCSWRRTRPHPQRIAAKTKQQHSRASVACQTRFGPHMSRISLLIILGIISLVLQLAEWKLPQNA